MKGRDWTGTKSLVNVRIEKMMMMMTDNSIISGLI